jgi:hypothetical protein
MKEPVVKTKEQSTSIASRVVEFFDPPMCCPTGLCGPTVNETLLDLSEAIRTLEREGVKVVRYQMANHPHAFLSNPEVMRLVREQQMAALPIIVVNTKVVKVGAYPSLSEIRRFLEEAQG